MNAKELRIGNLVNRLGEQTVIRAIEINSDGLGFVSTRLSGAVTSNQIEPIPLTEEWLLKFGFRSNKFTYSKPSNCTIDFDFKIIRIYNERHEDDICYNCPKYVHQLQNLYFALTGEELTLK